MIAHILPCAAAVQKIGCHGGVKGRHGSLRVALHAASRRQRPGLDPCVIPGGTDARRLRRALLLSKLRSPGARRRRQRAAGGNRGAHCALFALFGGARAVLGGALLDQRNSQNGRRGQGGPRGILEGSCGDRRRGHLRGPWPQVSNLGARTLSRGTRGGHREGPRVEEAAWLPVGGGGSARSTGMMAGGDGGNPAGAGGLAPPIPGLGRRIVEFLGVRDGGVYIDATFGAGGYSRAILVAADSRVIGIDRDQSAIALGAGLVESAGGRLVLVQERFSGLAEVARRCGHAAVDGVVFDLGVSSMQLDQAERGFSFRLDGPLDMRMGGAGPSAADVVAHASERELAGVIFTLGEERHARAIARAIVRGRDEAPIRTTRALADIVGRVVHARPDRIHPATRTFQGLRIFVNEELDQLADALAAAETALKAGGRLVVVSFHSLEDRIV